MQKKLAFLVLLVLVTLKINAQSFSYTLRLADSVAVSFPGVPGKGAGISYGYKDSSGVIFAASAADIAKAINFNKATFDSVVVEKEFANDFLDGFKPSMPNYHFKPVTISTLTGRVTYQIEGRDEAGKSNIYYIAVFINGIAYSFICILPDGKSIRDKNLFFKGITIGR